ncbi:MAG: NADH-quinone oxidoreductase subunit L [Thermomicrobiales bacterium]
MASYLFLIPLLPLAAFFINFSTGKWFIRDKAHLIAAPAVLGSWILSVLVFLDLRRNGEALDQRLFTWIPSGTFNVEVSLHVDQLTAIMLLVVTTVGFLVHLYSIGYMHGDDGFYRFFSYLPLFVFSMLMLVLADNYLLMFVFWEGVGLCSYLLIGYYFKRRSAGDAAKKAFIVNRVGDLGFGLGVMWIFTAFGTLNFFGEGGVFTQASAGAVSTGTLTGISLLLFLGACGKSAQFPLHVWLPDAMEGPTPVSALIHAATMVTAGIYMLVRSHAIIEQSHTAMVVIATVGAFTALMAASIALVQNDIKRIVAYSTVSQLGYTAFAVGTGAWTSAIFHLMTHAFFKGLLFLGCGSVIHGMHEEQDIQKMGNLRKYMPITFWTFMIASLANAGMVPFAGFWSKDEIIAGAWTSTALPSWGNVVAIVGLLAAFLTALYMFRLVFLTFFTKERFDTAHLHPHESGPSMTVPLILLAIPSPLIGFVGFPPDAGRIHRFLDPVCRTEEPATATAGQSASLYTVGDAGSAATRPAAAEAAPTGEHEISNRTKWTFGILSTVIALAGILVAYLTYIAGVINPVAVANRFPGLYSFLYEKWRFDELYDRLFVRPFKRLSMVLWQVVDVGVIDATVNGIASGVSGFSQRLRHVQTGLVANYALAIALGMVVMVGVYLAAFSNLFR